MQQILTKIAQNAMEYLVTEEIARQLDLYSETSKKNLNLYDSEIAIYALNRLPVLYAASTEELIERIKKAKQEYLEVVRDAVRKGFITLEEKLLLNEATSEDRTTKVDNV
ncbi:MAG: late competence development ComFB family protein [Prochloraceae cyanobacterium]|nr:late competence development ComFB family protein [Prochloraceae cyanobacterium]